MRTEEMTLKDYQEMKVKEASELREQITKLKDRLKYLQQLKDEKEKHEREIARPIFEYIWDREYYILKEYIEILESRFDLL